MLVVVRKLWGLCYNMGETAKSSGNTWDTAHKIAGSRSQDRAFPVPAKQPRIELVTFVHISVSVSQRHFRGLNVCFVLQSVGPTHVTPLSSHGNFTTSNQFSQRSKGLSLIQKAETEKIPNEWKGVVLSCVPHLPLT